MEFKKCGKLGSAVASHISIVINTAPVAIILISAISTESVMLVQALSIGLTLVGVLMFLSVCHDVYGPCRRLNVVAPTILLMTCYSVDQDIVRPLVNAAICMQFRKR